MPVTSGWRDRFGGRGRERTWWLLAAAVLFAVLWAVAQALKWPGWALAVLGGLAGAAALVVPELRARFKQDDTRAALVERAVTVPGGPARLPLVREAGLTQLRVHAAQVQVPYVQRDAQQSVADALGPGRAVLLVGHSMAGKTRLAAQVAYQRFPDRKCWPLGTASPDLDSTGQRSGRTQSSRTRPFVKPTAMCSTWSVAL